MPSLRPRPPLMRLTDAAAARIRTLMAAADAPVAGLRLGVKNGGCAGMSYTMEYVAAPRPGDEAVADRGVQVYVAPDAVLFLIGTEMDYRSDRLASGFVFNNPNEISACGCGESVSLRPADAELV